MNVIVRMLRIRFQNGQFSIFNFQMILLILFIALHSIQIKRIDLFSI